MTRTRSTLHRRVGRSSVLATILITAVVAGSLSLRVRHSPTGNITAPATQDRTATCAEPPDDGGVRWLAHYTVLGPSSQPLIRLSDVGFSGPPVISRQPPRPWVLSWMPQGTDQAAVVTGTAAALNGRVVPDSSVQLLTPDGACSLLISTPIRPADHEVAVIGDSVFASVANTVAKVGLDPPSPSTDWQIVARSGFGWGASPTAWPLGIVRGTWALAVAHGLITEHPNGLVIELGADDALRAAFAQATNDTTLVAAIRDGVSQNVTQILQETAPHVPCVIVVTAPTHPSNLFRSGTRYSTEALAIDAILREASARAGPSVRVADWAVSSASHHLPAGRDENWFLPGDDIHPNPAGNRALVALVGSELNACA